MNTLCGKSDHQLVELYEAGNDAAFDILLSRHQDYVFTYISFLVKREDVAEDLLQETFVKAVLAIRKHRYQQTGKFSAWLIRIAHNVVVDYLRDDEQASCTLGGEFAPNVLHNVLLSDKSREAEMADEQYVHTLRHMLDYLSQEQRDVVILRFYEDKSFKEIAQMTGVSINTALGRMRYALLNLRRLVQKHQLELVG